MYFRQSFLLSSDILDSRFIAVAISPEGSKRKIGGKLTVIGTGAMFFRPAVGFDGDYKNFQKVPCFFQATLEVHQQREQIPWGILIDYYKIDYFEDDDLLKAFLLKAKIDFKKKLEDENNAAQ